MKWINALLIFIDRFMKKFYPADNTVPSTIPHVPPVPVPKAVEASVEPVPPPPREILYMTAKGLLTPAQDVSPDDLADDEVACVESLENVYKKAFGTFIGGKQPLLSTSVLYERLCKDPRFQKITTPVNGSIIISPTGSGNGTVRGHVGVCGFTHIMANNSFTGNWSADYSYAQWEARWGKRGGMPVFYFRPV